MRRQGAGFTLIEVLIIVAIIGILAILIIVNFIGVQAKSRDARRKTSARNVDSALAQYFQDNSAYPNPNGAASVGGGIDISSNAIISQLSPNYLTTNNVFNHDRRAKYITNASGSNYAQAWELENTQEGTIITGNGVYSSTSNGADGVTTVNHTQGSALDFNSNTVITIASASLNSAFTVSVWVNLLNTARQVIILQKNTSSGPSWKIEAKVGGKVLITTVGKLGGISTLTSNTAIVPGVWTQIIFSFNNIVGPGSQGMKVYLAPAGSLLGSTPDATGAISARGSGANNTNNPIDISSPASGLLGGLDDLQFFDTELTGSTSPTVMDLHNDSGGQAGQYASNGEANLVGAWRLDEGSGTTANDVIGEAAPLAAGSANNISGIPVGPVTWTTGIVPLGLTWNNPLPKGHAFVTYGPE